MNKWNKGRRNELAKLKQKKRLELYGLKPRLGLSSNSKANHHAFKSHGKPCSCWCCRDEKHREKNRLNDKKAVQSEIQYTLDTFLLVNGELNLGQFKEAV